MTAKHGIVKGSLYRFKGMNMGYKLKIFEAVNLKTAWALVFCIYTCVYNFKRYKHK